MHYAAENVHWNTGKHALDDRAVCTDSSVFTLAFFITSKFKNKVTYY